MKKGLLGILLLLILVCFPTNEVFAAETEETPNMPKATFEDGILTISGEGDVTKITWNDYRNDIKKVVIEEGITGICEKAFYNMSGLQEAILPDSLQTIEGYVFDGCSGLKKVLLPTDLKVINECAFRGCVSMTEITLPDSLEQIGNYAFDRCNGLAEITIPKNVKKIGYSPFRDCTAFERVFYFAIDAKSESQPSTLIYGCEKLKEFKIGEEVQTIPCSLIAKSGIETITIPENVKKINGVVCSECDSLKELNFDAVSATGYALCKSNNNMAMIQIGPKVEKIADVLSIDCNVSEITFPANKPMSVRTLVADSTVGQMEFNENVVHEKGYNADYMIVNSTIRNLTFGKEMTSIPDYFSKQYCVETWNWEGQITKIGNYAFAGMAGIKELTLPEGVQVIGEGAFADATMNAVDLPDSLTEIKRYAFSRCASLKEISIPKNVESIGRGIVEGAVGLKSVYYNAKSAQYSRYGGEVGEEVFANLSSLSDFQIGNEVESLPSHLVRNCPITTVTIPKAVKRIGSMCFDSCKQLLEIDYQAINAVNETTILQVFRDCNNVSTLKIDDGVRSLPGEFINENQITRLVIPKGVEEIGMNFVSGCSKLKEIDYEAINVDYKGLVSGYYQAGFISDCKGIELFSVGEECQQLPNYLLNQCEIEKMVIPSNIQNIGMDCLIQCQITECLKIDSDCWDLNYNLTPYAKDAFAMECEINCLSFGENIKSIPAYFSLNCKIRTMQGAEQIEDIQECAFREITGIDNLQSFSSLKRIGDYAFRNSALKQVTIGEQVEEIGKYAFKGCEQLSSVTYLAKNASGASSFSDCEKLSNFEIGEKVQSLPTQMIERCPVEELVIPENIEAFNVIISGDDKLKRIEYYAPRVSGTCVARGCDFLEEVIIGDQVSTLPSGMFDNCKIKTVTILRDMETTSTVFRQCVIDELIIGEEVENIPAYLTADCEIHKLTVLGSPSTVGKYSFSGCRGIEEFPFLDSVETIGDYAFQYVADLKEIRLSKNLKTMGAYAFRGCNKVEKVQYDAKNLAVAGQNSYLFENQDKLTEIVIGDNVESLPSRFINNCGITSFIIPKGVQKIGHAMIYGCKNLTRVEYLAKDAKAAGTVFDYCNNLEEISFGEEVTVIPNQLLLNCNVKEIRIPKNIKTIGAGAFWNLSKLEKVIYEAEQLDRKGETTPIFYHCENLKEFVIGNQVKEIPAYLVEGCNAIDELRFGDALESIGEHAFYQCQLLNTIYIPENVTKIGTDAFYYTKCQQQVIKGYYCYGTDHSAAYQYCLAQMCRWEPMDPKSPNHTYGKMTKNEYGMYRGVCKVCGHEYLSPYEDDYESGGSEQGTSYSIQKRAAWITSLPTACTLVQGESILLANVTTVQKDNGAVSLEKSGKQCYRIVAKTGGIAKLVIEGKDKNGTALEKPKTIKITVVAKGTMIKSAKPGKKKITISWDKRGEASGYQIQYSMKKNFQKAKTITVKGGNQSSKKLTKLKKKKKYYIRIRAYTNQTQYCSGWSGVKSVKTK